MPKWDKISVTVHDFNLKEVVYTVKEFALKTGMSEQTLNRWHRSGIFVSDHIIVNKRKYRYYTETAYKNFILSDLYKESPVNKNKDLIGKRLGKLYIKRFSDAAVRKGYYASYLCECDCGNVLVLPRSYLLDGKHLSCGCRFTDLSEKTFGYWSVLSLERIYNTPCGSNIYLYRCRCKCGTERNIISTSLTSGASQSCGCLKTDKTTSKYEHNVLQYLTDELYLKPNIKNGYGFIRNKSFKNLLGLGGRHLTYDFYIEVNYKKFLIECQGGQHYFPVEKWGGEKAFIKQLEHDKRKTEYASKYGIQLIKIPHTIFNYTATADLLKNLITKNDT